MIRFLTRTDCHLTDKAPVSRIDNYTEAIFDKLEQIYQIATDKGCYAILDSADFFHIKAPGKNSHSLNSRVIEQHRRYSIPVYSVIGNHDVRYNNLGLIDEQPLGVLFKSGIFNRCDDTTLIIDGMKIRLVGVHYETESDFSRCIKKDEDVLIALFHGNVTTTAIYPGEIFYTPKDLANLGPDIWVCGHIHKDQGIIEQDGKYFICTGAVARGALIQDNIERIPRVALIEIEGKSKIHIEPIELKVRPASEIFDLERRTQVIEEEKNIDEFIKKLIESTSVDTEDRLMKVINSLDLVKEIRETILSYIASAEHVKIT